MASRLLGAVNISLCKSFLAAEPIVELERGGFITYHGTSTGPVEHFQNITYGHDTSGIRRSAPPEPCLAPEGKEVSSMPQHQAQHAPSFRAQYHSSSPRCPKLARTVSICAFARPKAPRRMIKLPVVVHIFTGGLTRASAEDIPLGPWKFHYPIHFPRKIHHKCGIKFPLDYIWVCSTSAAEGAKVAQLGHA